MEKLIAFITAAVMAMAGGANASGTAGRPSGTAAPDYYGKCRVTAYSGRNGVTYGASGNTLIPCESCAAGRNIPLGSRLYIEGYGIVTVEDRFDPEYDEEYGGMVIDLYLESYSAACGWGLKELNVYIIDKGVDIS